MRAWAALTLAVWAVALVSPAWADALSRVEIGAAAPDFVASGADGQQHRLGDYIGKVVVLEWTSPVCPYTAAKYKAGLMQSVQRRALAGGAIWLSIDTASPRHQGYLTPTAAKARLAKTGARVSAFLFDPDGRIGRVYGARTTPHLYVIAKDGRLAYQGALDDEPSRKHPGGFDYVTAALSDLQSGKPVRNPETRPYGCAVEY
jgi:AhpC/TSA family